MMGALWFIYLFIYFLFVIFYKKGPTNQTQNKAKIHLFHIIHSLTLLFNRSCTHAQIALAVRHLHESGIVHGRLRSSNILIDSHLWVTIAGISCASGVDSLASQSYAAQHRGGGGGAGTMSLRVFRPLKGTGFYQTLEMSLPQLVRGW